MNNATWIASYLANLGFWFWIIRWGGAERLEGTFTSGFLVSILAPGWSAEGIKLFGWCTLVVSTTVFVLGIFLPDFRN